MKNKILIAIIFSLFTMSGAVAQSFKVVVNNANNTTTISSKDLSSYLLKKKKKWSNGTTVKPVDQKTSSPVREAFTVKVHKKKVSSIRSYWQQAIFSGVATAPAEKGSDKEVIDYVKANPGAVGYVSAGANIQGVKEIKISD
ncbi:hypothetical protein [Labilibacter marinus]|uniref:hypothetical protein n=1 Tax=Labilibacter marinus TaxID=1477105 RepID=UPI00094F97B2|nr:hypothetical protein [Labilibacter marinus]